MKRIVTSSQLIKEFENPDTLQKEIINQVKGIENLHMVAVLVNERTIEIYGNLESANYACTRKW